LGEMGLSCPVESNRRLAKVILYPKRIIKIYNYETAENYKLQQFLFRRNVKW